MTREECIKHLEDEIECRKRIRDKHPRIFLRELEKEIEIFTMAVKAIEYAPDDIVKY